MAERAPRLGLIGAGRLSGAMAAYWRALGHAVTVLTRAEAHAADARERVEALDLIALATPDDAIAPWVATLRRDWGVTGPLLHFSAARAFDGAWSYHPLYSFPAAPLSARVTGTVTIARQPGAPTFASLVPGATNPELEVRDEDRALYHALAVLTGNFSAHVWNEAAAVARDRLGVDPAALFAPYLAGVVDRFAERPTDSVTGPVARRDAGTVAANQAALADHPRLAALYEAFLKSAWTERSSDD